MASYQSFAQVYDDLMASAPYESWIQWLNTIFKQESFSNPAILEAGCGTGTILSYLLKEGYKVDGFDLSEDMLAVANNKLGLNGFTDSLLMCQDMRHFDMGKQYDIIMTLCDSINYLRNKEEVCEAFHSFHSHLTEGGLLIFDAHSLFYINEILKDVSIAESLEDISYIWNTFPTEVPGEVEHELTLFIRQEQNLYERFDELHLQRTFSVKEYEDMLRKSGFLVKGIYADFTLSSPRLESERLFFVAEKFTNDDKRDNIVDNLTL